MLVFIERITDMRIVYYIAVIGWGGGEAVRNSLIGYNDYITLNYYVKLKKIVMRIIISRNNNNIDVTKINGNILMDRCTYLYMHTRINDVPILHGTLLFVLVMIYLSS